MGKTQWVAIYYDDRERHKQAFFDTKEEAEKFIGGIREIYGPCSGAYVTEVGR